ncbi:MAG: hypothetical protein PHW54_02275 [Candidatus Omnitrophica bacterium]|nr:hypothetical protein [Candidatus Omnitrophota bacterium]
MRENSRNKIIAGLIFIVILWFLFLCLLNYFAQKPRMDEGEVLRNIQELSIPQLFGELKYNQVFPRSYLALISFFSAHFSYSLLSLRLFPLLFMMAGFFLWVYIYKQEAKSNFYLFLLIFSFSSSMLMVDYAGYLKQYSCDVFAIAAFTLFIYYQKKYFNQETSIKCLWFFSIVTPVLIAFSQMSFFIFWIIIYNYLFLLRENKKVLLPFAVYTFLAVLFCLLVYWFDIRHSMRIKFIQEYWNNSFIDTSSLYNFSKTFTNGLQNILVRWFIENKIAKSVASVFMPFALIAIGKSFWVSLKDNKGKILDISSICGVLIIELFILGVFKIYPFTGSRITLFIAPFIFFMIVQGIYLVRKIKLIFVPLLSVYIIFLSGVSYHLLWFYLNFYKK